MTALAPFGLFAAAFYLTGIGYVYQSRGMTGMALITWLVVVALMVAFFRQALRRLG